MPTTIIVTHDVRDFDFWKSTFEEAKTFREQNGEKSSKVFRSVDNPNRITVINEWRDLDSAKTFIQDDEFKTVMNQAGVLGRPHIEIVSQT